MARPIARATATAAPLFGWKLACRWGQAVRLWLWVLCTTTASAQDAIEIRTASELVAELESGEHDLSLRLSGRIDLNGTALNISGQRNVTLATSENQSESSVLHAQNASRVIEVRRTRTRGAQQSRHHASSRPSP